VLLPLLVTAAHVHGHQAYLLVTHQSMVHTVQTLLVLAILVHFTVVQAAI
jgi:hypothetical protein